jgi:hypothetical protein
MDKEYEPYWSNYLKQFDISNDNFKNIKNITDKFCIIIEPRIHTNLILVIKNFMFLLQNKDWGLIIFHSNKNKNFLKSKLYDIPNIIYINITEDNLTIHEYNQLFYSKNLWNILKDKGCKHALFFQTDTLLLKDNVDDFIKYDYVGAPWNKNLPWRKSNLFYNVEVGNGGLSLRNVDIMIKILDKYSNDSMMRFNEDGFYSYYCVIEKYNIPSLENAMKFSVETIYYDSPCGLHKPWLSFFPNKNSYINMLNIKHT